MSQKRRAKLEKRKSKKNKKPRNVLKKAIPGNILENPYSNINDLEADILLMNEAWERHYGEIPEDFIPPMFENTEQDLRAAGWIETFSNLMLEKYKSSTLVEPKVKFILMNLNETIVDGC